MAAHLDLVAETRVPSGLRPKLRRVMSELLRSRGVTSAVCLVLTDDERIRALKRDHWGEDAVTDVLSFPAWEPGDPFVPPHLGDIVISLDTARRQASERGHDLETEVVTLAAHGLTHLLGHDHETDPEWAPFEAAQAEAVRALGDLRGRK